MGFQLLFLTMYGREAVLYKLLTSHFVYMYQYVPEYIGGRCE